MPQDPKQSKQDFDHTARYTTQPPGRQPVAPKLGGQTAVVPVQKIAADPLVRRRSAVVEDTGAHVSPVVTPPPGFREEGMEIRNGIKWGKRLRANSGCLQGAMYFLVIVTVSLFVALQVFSCANDMFSLLKPNDTVVVEIPEGLTIDQLAVKLRKLGVIEKPWLFKFYCKKSGAAEKITPGSYEISKKLDYHALVRSFRHNLDTHRVVSVTIPEGLTVDETITRLVEAGVSNRAALEKAEAETEFNFAFLDDVPMQPGRLEGFLYPDKYDFYTDENPDSVLQKFLRNFNQKLSGSMRKYIDEKSKYSTREIVTIASMIQLETADLSEMKDISSVIHNRLEDDDFEPHKLQIDCTLLYVMKQAGITRRNITSADKELNSPYNTYLNEGLPPGPVCSVSIDAIRAAIYPTRSDYFYYALTKTGKHKFVRYKSEHDQIIRDNPEVYDR